jgi:antitoxin component of RelBE/YafQ-DinJ toxin-antitoxin module
MTQNAVVRARISTHIKTKTMGGIAYIWLTVSGAFCIMMVRIATKKTPPFKVHIPYSKTIDAMNDARSVEHTQVESTVHLLASLKVGD